MAEESSLDKDICFATYWFNDYKLLICDHYGLDVYIIGLNTGHNESVLSLNRRAYDDGSLYRVNFIDFNYGSIFVYEGGVIVFNIEGGVHWHHKHKTLDILFKNVEDGVVRFQSEFEGGWAINYQMEIKFIKRKLALLIT